MPSRSPATAPPSDRTIGRLLSRYHHAGTPLSCQPVARGLLNRGYRVATTRGRFFLKQYLDDPDRDTARPETIARQHHATLRLGALGLPVAAPLRDADGRTVVVIGGSPYALYPWVDGRHRAGTELSFGESRRLGALLGRVHTCLERVLPPQREPATAVPHPSASPEDSYALIDELLRLARRHRPRDAFDALAEDRLLERRALLERHAHRRPADATTRVTGWVHGDFHPFNLLYRGAEPAAIVDWDRLGVQPRAEEAVRAAAIFFLREEDGTLDLARVRGYAGAYRRTARVTAAELATAVHRVWWERLNDLWMLRWRYQRHDRRADPLFPAAAGLVVWWTREYEEVLAAFTG
ncbi:phosphotransferase [Streptomyces sp. ICBB 8177]|uniref:phosphotransferase n=1 Tax=Streptomyces sp. ICBB 8177 TaxID=563922 RepID=UPI000D683066|nr:phosphotransferase [Streptomyces sp. ICBB 8177]PWI41272.1 aminoglycoside phosphotransferase [Streptomyces sp. ICBB 8177]